MAHDDGKLYFYSALGFGAGIWIFVKGFREFRKYRVLADTPEIPIRSMPMGLVEIHGQAVKAAELLTSPVTHTPCCLFKVDIEHWKRNEKGSGGHWVHHRTDIQAAPFYLQDASGKVLVEPKDAELDLPQNARCEAGPGSGRTGTARGVSDQELLQYVSQANVHAVTNFVARGISFLGPRNDPQHEQTRQKLLDLFSQAPGTADFQQRMMTLMAPKLHQHLREMGPQTDPQKEQARLAALEAFEHPQGSPEFVAGMQRAASFAPPDEQKHFLAAVGALDASDSAVRMVFSAATGRYRLTEYGIVPGQAYDITGTCTENPNPQDEHDRNLILKGQNEPTFLISSRTEREVERTVRNKALKMIFGGAALSLICLAIILGKLGLF
jgi:hypothetical protein